MDAIYPKTFDYVFKYMPECGLSSEAVNEYAIAKALDGAGLTPRVYALSLPVEVDAGSVISEKVPGDCRKTSTKPGDLESQNGESINNPTPALIVVRAILQDKVGKTLEEYFKGVQSLVLNKVEQQSYRARHEWVGVVVAAIQLGIKSVELVRAFHSSGFLHNDINHRNIALRGTSPKELVLINFGKATPVPQADLGASREDLFAAVEIVAALLTTSFSRSLGIILNEFSPAERVTYRDNAVYFSGELYRVSADTNDIPRGPEKGQSICAFYFGQAGGGTYSTRCAASMVKMDQALALLRRSVDVTAPCSAVIGLMKKAIAAISVPMKDRSMRALGL